jgi:7,8-dihydropterin-6-yl-methyl-4-(beta-D-ribofuranosyl)aminobenzene 5'-phosphate synthase
MGIRLTTLSENTASLGFVAEWGLSILVEADGLRVLLDTGLSISAVHNAQLLGIDLTQLDRIVLSHGHFDHTGGLRDVLRRKGEIEVIAHPDVWAPKYGRLGDQELYIGVPYRREELESLGARFRLKAEPVELGASIVTTGQIPMRTAFEEVDPDIFVKQGGALVPDPLADDLALVIRTGSGLVIVLGCAHRGAVNTILHARELTGEDRVFAVVGGAHLFRASENQIEETIRAFKEIGVQQVGVSHCTGFYASARLADAFGDDFFLNNAGTSLTLP